MKNLINPLATSPLSNFIKNTIKCYLCPHHVQPRKETKEVAQSVAKAFRALRGEVQEQIEYLDKKPGLTKGEKEIRDKLQEILDISEEFIGKEIKDVEKELE